MIKSELKNYCHVASYPKLMIGVNGCIVLFEKSQHGTCIYKGLEGIGVGEYSHMWDMSCFHDFKGKVVLENQE